MVMEGPAGCQSAVTVYRRTCVCTVLSICHARSRLSVTGQAVGVIFWDTILSGIFAKSTYFIAVRDHSTWGKKTHQKSPLRGKIPMIPFHVVDWPHLSYYALAYLLTHHLFVLDWCVFALLHVVVFCTSFPLFLPVSPMLLDCMLSYSGFVCVTYNVYPLLSIEDPPIPAHSSALPESQCRPWFRISQL